MLKKCTAILIVVIIAASSVFASGILQLGGSAELPLPLASMKDMGTQFKQLENYRFGAEIRFAIPTSGFLGFHFGLRSMISFGNPFTFNSNTDGTANLAFFNDKRANFYIGAGVNMLIRYASDEWTFNYSKDFWDTLAAAPIIYTAGVNLTFGPTFSLFYTIPTLTSIKNFTLSGLVPQAANGRIGASVLINLF